MKLTMKSRIILTVIIVIGTIFFTIKDKAKYDAEKSDTFSSVEQQSAIEYDTISVMINYTIAPYTQKYARTATNRFDLSYNYGEVTRSFSTSFNDTTESITVVDSSLPGTDNGEHSSFAFYGSTISQDFMFRTADGAPNTYKNTIRVDYTKGDSAASIVELTILPRGLQTIMKTYTDQLRVQSQNLATNLMITYLKESQLPEQPIILMDSIAQKVLPETLISVANDTLTYTANGETVINFVFSTTVPKL